MQVMSVVTFVHSFTSSVIISNFGVDLRVKAHLLHGYHLLVIQLLAWMIFIFIALILTFRLAITFAMALYQLQFTKSCT